MQLEEMTERQKNEKTREKGEEEKGLRDLWAREIYCLNLCFPICVPHLGRSLPFDAFAANCQSKVLG